MRKHSANRSFNSTGSMIQLCDHYLRATFAPRRLTYLGRMPPSIWQYQTFSF
jgi:hypothetical protein